jgi:hypothetical protein
MVVLLDTSMIRLFFSLGPCRDQEKFKSEIARVSVR